MPRSTVRRRRCLGIAGVGLLIAGLSALWLPPFSAASSTLPVGRSLVVTVPLFNAWTIWWNCDRLAHGFRGYWDAPIFFPEQQTFAFSEPQPATLIVAPVLWGSGSPILAYNAYLWLSLLLNGLVTLWLLKSLGHRTWLAGLGAIAMLLLPLVHDQIEVLQLIPLWGVLWSWEAARRLGDAPTPARGAAAGLALAMTFAMSLHHGLFAVILAAGPVLVLVRDWRKPRLYASGAVGIGVAALLILPLILPVRAALAARDFERTPDRAASLSALPASYLAISDECLLQAEWVAPQRFELSAGWTRSALAAVGVLAVLRRRRRRWCLFLLLTAVLAFALSLGPHLQLGRFQPWEPIRQWVPGLVQVRSVFRFAYFFQMAVVLLAIEGAHLLWLLANRRPGRARLWGGLRVAVVAVAVLAALETWPRRPEMAGTPTPRVNRGWIEFVQARTTPGRGIVCLPFATGHGARDFIETTRWMYLGTFHGVPLVNGYSGYFPASDDELREVMAEGFFTSEALNLLEAAGTEFVVIRTVLIQDRAGLEAAISSGRLVPAYEDPMANVDVYRLARRAGDQRGAAATEP